ncbi:MAG: hypothetical protein JWN23_961 [Rhodocyclales bacterium]|nr:hypothetical protein [Rhodocyclales bacterium]
MKSGDALYQIELRVRLESLTGFVFQDFIERLHYKRYTADRFTNLRPVRDGGCDGLVENVPEPFAIAAYGPDQHVLRKFKRKATEDHSLYKSNWQKRCPAWRLYINCEPSPEQLNHIHALGKHTSLWGTTRLLNMIEELDWPQKYALCKFLGIEEALLGRDIIRHLLDDLLSGRVQHDNIESRLAAPDIQAKIELNYAPEDWLDVAKHAQLTVQPQIEVSDALAAYSDAELTVIYNRLTDDFGETQFVAGFGNRMRALQWKYQEKYNASQDDFIRLYIDAFLAYVFHRCLIGTDPKKGEGHVTPAP